MPENGRWDLIRRLKSYYIVLISHTSMNAVSKPFRTLSLTVSHDDDDDDDGDDNDDDDDNDHGKCSYLSQSLVQ
jgi:hypothetical protein